MTIAFGGEGTGVGLIEVILDESGVAGFRVDEEAALHTLDAEHLPFIDGEHFDDIVFDGAVRVQVGGVGREEFGGGVRTLGGEGEGADGESVVADGVFG